MMTSKWIHTAIMAFTLTLSGCNKQGSVNTGTFQKSFATAEAQVQGSADKVVAAIKSADYSSALTELKSLASNVKLTPEQQQAIKDLMVQVRQQITTTATKAADDASKAVSEAPKALPK
jgi:hypothetical protein